MMKRPKIYANVIDVGGSSSVNQTLVEVDLPFSSLGKGRKTHVISLVQCVFVGARALWSQSAAIRTERVVADQSPGCEQQRTKLTPPYPEQVYESVQELLGCDIRTGIELAVENGNHVFDLPIFDEMRTLLDHRHKAWYGYQYGREHAPTVIVSGLYGHEEWSNRCIKVKFGTHLHAAVAIKNQTCRQRPVSHRKDRLLNPLDSNKKLEFLYD